MIQLHFGVTQLSIGKHMGTLHLFVWNYVKYANMEGFHRDNYILQGILQYQIKYHLSRVPHFVFTIKTS